jgi:5-methylcytosine-specific restriction endonuclease McrA
VIRLKFVPPENDADWRDWIDRCAAEVARMLQPGSDRRIEAELYKRQRERLLAATNRKCAYCELPLAAGQRAGDVEHYRPKARVRDGTGKLVKIRRPDGSEAPHPGYFWLAYEYRNLLPACSACNRRATDRASGRLTGKADIFPTLDDRWAAMPEELPNEKPALLNPWLPEDNPTDHLAFDPETGLVMGLTERGRLTVSLLGLNRDGLPEARLSAAQDVRRIFGDAVEDRARREVSDEDARRLQAVKDGSAAYAAVCRVELKRTVRKVRSWLDWVDDD